MCALYAGIYRVALRLQKAAETRRSRMAASLVSVASHTITHIGLGMSAAAPMSSAPVTLATDASARSTAVAELHSSNAGGENETMTSPDACAAATAASNRTSDDDDELHRATLAAANSVEALRNNRHRLDMGIGGGGNTRQREVAPLLKHCNDRPALNMHGGADVSLLPVARMTSSSRQRRWTVVLPGNDEDDDIDESLVSISVSNEHQQWKSAVGQSVDDADRTPIRSSRRSMIELSTLAAPGVEPPSTSPLAGPSTSTMCLRESGSCEQAPCDDCTEMDESDDDEIENVVNDIIDEAITTGGEKSPATIATGKQQSPAPIISGSCGGHLSADMNQLAMKNNHVTTATMTSVVESRNGLEADGRRRDEEEVWAAGRRREPHASKTNDVADAEKSVRRMTDRWRHAARSHFTANRRFAHLRHWKLHRRFAGSTSTSSSIDDRQMLVSTPPTQRPCSPLSAYSQRCLVYITISPSAVVYYFSSIISLLSCRATVAAQ